MKQLAHVYTYFNHRRIRKIVGISVGTAITIAMIVIAVITCVKATKTGTSNAFSLTAIIVVGVIFLLIAVKDFFDLLDLNGSEQIFNKIVKKMSLNKMIKLDMTNFFPEAKEELYNKFLMSYVEGKKLYVKLEATDFPYRMNLQFYPTKDEKDSFSVWFTVDDYKDIERIWKFIKEHEDK